MSYNILIAEDEQDINDLLCEHLKAQGYKVFPYFDGQSALDAINNLSNDIDLFLLDWMMPGKNGVEICKNIRETANLKNRPIIILTARSDSDSVIEGLDSGANDYISKPFDLRELTARIRTQLRSNTKKKSIDNLRYKDLNLNTSSYMVSVNDQEIKLTKSEFLMLKNLLSKPNTVFTRKELIVIIQGDQTFVTDRTIDTHMASIRKKISPYSDQIKTIRGIGYKFEV